MKRSVVFLLTSLALTAGVVDAARRSGGGFGGSSRSSSSSSRSSSGGPYRSSGSSTYTPRSTPSSNSSSSSSYTTPRSSSSARTPSSAQRRATYPSTSSVRQNPANVSAAARVTPTQLSNWNKVSLPAGVPRSAITYSAAPSSQYRYQLQAGRYYPYPQSYYRQRGIGYDLLKYAVIFTAVSSLADAATPDVVLNDVNTSATTGQGDLSDLRPGQPVQPSAQPDSGPNLWSYVGVGFLAAAAAWFVGGRSRRRE